MSTPLPHRLIALACLALALMWPAWGADTEIYTKSDAQTPAVPNVLLLLEVSEPMRTQNARNEILPTSLENSLLSQAIDNAENLINYYYENRQTTPIRIGLMRYLLDHGRLLVPVANLDREQVELLRDALTKMRNAKMGGYGTSTAGQNGCREQASEMNFDPDACPTGEYGEILLTDQQQASNMGALHEAWIYYEGTPSNSNQGLRGRTTGSGNNYESPIEYECQKNHVVVFTDGNPPGQGSQPSVLPSLSINPPPSELQDCTDCLSAMAEYMRTTDVSTGDHGQPGEQNVETHFVRLKPYTRSPDPTLAAAVRNGSYGEPVESNRDLFTEDDQQLDFINHVATPEVPPSITQQIGSQVVTRSQTISATGEVSYEHHIYFGLFQPGENKRWPGNIKKYGLETDAQGSISGIVDKGGNPVIVDGEFSADATSYWNLGNEPDGNQITEGGAANRLTEYRNDDHTVNDRRVFTHKPKDTSTPRLGRIRPEGTPLNNNRFAVDQSKGLRKQDDNRSLSLDPGAENRISRCSGTDIPAGLGNRRERALANWIRGQDICDEDGDTQTNDGRPRMGAMLHSKPVVVPFGGDVGNVILVLSNDGYLHMLQIDETNEPGVVGSSPVPRLERGAIFPGAQLVGDNLLRTYELLEDMDGEPMQMLDGGIAVFAEDGNNDDDLLDIPGNPGAADVVVAYFGQRRGGRDIFAYHLGNLSNFSTFRPLRFWHIQGGEEGTEFENLGQTWSTPRRTTITKEGQMTQPALLFGGGYDDANFDCTEYMPGDNKNCAAASLPEKSIGNAIYMLDPYSSAPLWWASASKGGSDSDVFEPFTDMKYSFPAPLRLVDTNNDGHTDAFFAVDIGGQVWRFDIDPPITGLESIKQRISGGVIADLHGGAESELQNRRFYNTPDVAFTRDTLGNRKLRINIGSGYRAHPLDTGTQDRMYSLVQPLAKPRRYTKIEIGNLLNITALDTESEIAALNTEQRTKLDKGWYLNLNRSMGEKMLSNPFTFRGITYFTTYTPPENDPLPCAPPNLGTNRLYIVDFNNGLPVVNLNQADNSNTSTIADPDPIDESGRSVVLKGTTGIAPTPDLVLASDNAQIIAGTEILDDTGPSPIPDRQIIYWIQDEP